MNTDQIINNMRHAKPKLYTMAVAHATRAFMKKAGRAPDTIPEDYERAMIEAIVEGIVYTMVPLLAATLVEMQAAEAEVAPPAVEGGDLNATTAESPPLLDLEDEALEANARNPDGTPYRGHDGGPASDGITVEDGGPELTASDGPFANAGEGQG